MRSTIPAALVSTVLLISLVGSACSSSPKRKEMTRRERAILMVQVAQGSLMEGDPTAALKALKGAEELDPSLVEIYHSRALAFEAKKDLNQALVEAKKAVVMAPNSSAALNTLGKLLLDLGKPAEAISPLTRAAKDPYYSEAYKPETNLGILHYRSGDYDRAMAHFERATHAAPLQTCHAHYYLGHIHLRKGQFENAVTEYEKATQRFCSKFADAHFALGIAFERSRRYDDARKMYLSIRSTFPRSKFASKAMERLRDIP